MIYVSSHTKESSIRVFSWVIAATILFHLIVLISKVSMTSDFIISKTEEKILKIKFVQHHSREKKKQVVENENRGIKEKPIDSMFLSEKDNKASRQTVARKIEKFNKAAKGVKDGSRAATQSKQASKSKSQEKKQISLSDLRVAKAKGMLQEFAPSAASAPLGLKTGDIDSKGESSSSDFVEEIPLGDFTELNTTEYKYYGFYHRIKEKLEQFWGLSIQEQVSKIYRKGRRLPAGQNHITSLVIDLDQNGKIISVSVKGTSGFKELDQAAVESFNKAGPFPNPPKGMIKKGRATIEWGFVVKS